MYRKLISHNYNVTLKPESIKRKFASNQNYWYTFIEILTEDAILACVQLTTGSLMREATWWTCNHNSHGLVLHTPATWVSLHASNIHASKMGVITRQQHGCHYTPAAWVSLHASNMGVITRQQHGCHYTPATWVSLHASNMGVITCQQHGCLQTTINIHWKHHPTNIEFYRYNKITLILDFPDR